MDEQPWIPILAPADGPTASTLCTLAAPLVAVSGAGVTIMTDTALVSMCVYCSDPVAHMIEDLQFSLGEGPCLDAYIEGRPVSEPDLASPTPGRWLGFVPGALAAGAAAVFAFPLRVGGARIGALDLYRDRPGPLSSEQFAEAEVLAAMIAHEILAVQAHAPAGTIAAGLVGEPGLRPVVHQATGIIAAQLNISLGDALARLRARAYADNVGVTAVATDVVERELRFED